jgi:hypothetical protein
LKALMTAWADGLNFYLSTAPSVTPRVIKPLRAVDGVDVQRGQHRRRHREGSISISSQALSNANPGRPQDRTRWHLKGRTRNPIRIAEPSGFERRGIAPANPPQTLAAAHQSAHVSFFFRSELQMTSDEGLKRLRRVDRGDSFFIYQGFNERAGWMHTSSGVDATDEFLETVVKKGDKFFYKIGADELPMTTSTIKVPYKTATGMAERTFTVYRTVHGPVIRSANGKWVTFALMQEPVKALTQSYSRTKATDYTSFKKTMDLHTNSSNNTIFADNSGNIAYFHGNFIPRRDPKFDWTRPVDGSDPATKWGPLLSVDESPKLLNPASGWLYNSNNWPWSAAGASSPKKADFPAYVETAGESARGLHAIRVLQNKKDFTLDGLIAAAYDSYLTWFEKPIPALIKAFDALGAAHPLKIKLADQMALLRAWNLRWGVSSVATSLAIGWAEDVQGKIATAARQAGVSNDEYLGTQANGEVMLQSLATASDKLAADFGSWKTPWGDINRFQRLTDDIVHPFTDSGPSIPVAFTSATWGSLASFGRAAVPRIQEDLRHQRQTASSPSSNSARRCARRPSPPVARAATRSQSTSTIRRCGTARAICARCISILRSSRAHRARVSSGRVDIGHRVIAPSGYRLARVHLRGERFERLRRSVPFQFAHALEQRNVRAKRRERAEEQCLLALAREGFRERGGR